MKLNRRIARIGAAAMMLASTAACSNMGNVLGSVLGGGPQQSGQISGTIQGVNPNTQQITIQQSNGQSIAASFDNQTRVVYQNQNYPPTSLEYGDRVTANVQALQNGSYYTDYIQVDQSVSASGGGGATGNAQSVQGNVRQVDSRNGLFTVDAGNYGLLTVSLPYNPRSSDVSRFQNLRSGDFVRFYGVFLNNSRVELRQFY